VIDNTATMLWAIPVEAPSGQPSHVWQLWLVLILTSSLAYVIGRTRWWPMAVLLAFLTVLLSLAVLHELGDPAIEGGLSLDFGERYVWHSKIAAALVGLGPICAVIAGRRGIVVGSKK
jgi:hypothetical protein